MQINEVILLCSDPFESQAIHFLNSAAPEILKLSSTFHQEDFFPSFCEGASFVTLVVDMTLSFVASDTTTLEYTMVSDLFCLCAIEFSHKLRSTGSFLGRAF